MDKPVNDIVIFVGNPGVGKSTLLNQLVQKVVFKSGISLGTGVPTKAQYCDTGDFILFDTPGLADCDEGARANAARELEKMFQILAGKSVKIIFVLVLEAGRLVRQDVVTMRLVDVAIDMGANYSVIYNKMDPRVTEMFDHRKMTFETVKLTRTNSFLLLPRKEEMSCKNNYLADLDPNLKNFVAKAPRHTIPLVIGKILHQVFDLNQDKLEQEISRLAKENRSLQ